LKRKFVTNLGFFLVLNLLIKPVYVFAIDRVVQNTVGAEIYGRFFTLLNIAFIFQIILDLGIENFIRKEIARHPEKASYYFSNIIVLKLILFLPYFIVCCSVAFFQNYLSGDYQALFLLILLNQFLASFILFIRANLGGLQFFKTESFVSVADRSLMIIIVGTLLLYPLTKSVFRISWFIIAQTISYGITLISGIILLKKKSLSFTKQIDLKQFGPIIKSLLPYATLVLLMAFYYRADSIFLGLLLPDGDEQAGIYAHGFRILDFMSNYALLFPILLIPLFSGSIHEKKKVDSLLELSSLLLIVPSFAVITPAVLYRRELFDVLYNEHIELSANAFAILTISFLGMCISYTFGALLTANGNLKQLNIMAAFAVLVSLLLNLILIPRYKVLGATIANASAQLLTVFIHIALAWKIFKLKFNPVLLLKLAGFFIFQLILAIILKRSDLHWLYGSVILAGASILFAVVTRLLNIKGFLIIFRQEKPE
jgi:O-antigen/teichoic acid export membrane protein